MIDLKLTPEGDLVVNESGDLAVVYGDEQIAQEVLFRLKTTLGDWTLSPNVGASLEEFIGEPNTPIVHAAIEQRIEDCLTKDNLLFLPTIDVIPIDLNEVLIVVEFGSLEDDERNIQIQAGLDLRKGLVFARTQIRNLQ